MCKREMLLHTPMHAYIYTRVYIYFISLFGKLVLKPIAVIFYVV